MTAGAQHVDLMLLGPPLVTALGALVVLLADVLRPGAAARNQRPARWTSWLALAVVVTAAVPLLVLSRRLASGGTFCLDTAWDVARACSYDTAWPTLPLQWLVLAGGALVVLMGGEEVVRRRMPSGEYHFLLLASITGALVLVAARDLATAVVALETVTLPLVAMVALSRRARGAQAGLALFLSSVISLAVSLYGIALLYSATGTLHYSQLAEALRGVEHMPAIAEVGAVMVLAVFVFKVAAVPFQAWAPDAYAGSPVPVAAYLSVVSKTAGLGGLAVLLLDGLGPLARAWGLGLAVVVVATFVVGNVVALRQGSLVRLLAWSSVAQLAYVLLPLAAVGFATTRHPSLTAAPGPEWMALGDAVSAALAYLAAYAAMTIAAWAVTLLLIVRLRPRHGVLLIEDLRGLARRSPWLGGAMLFAFACLAGLPPGIVGLVVKVRVFPLPAAAAPAAAAPAAAAPAAAAPAAAAPAAAAPAATSPVDHGLTQRIAPGSGGNAHDQGPDPEEVGGAGPYAVLGPKLALAAATVLLVATSLAPALLLDRF